MVTKTEPGPIKKLVSKLTNQAAPAPDPAAWEKRFNSPPFVEIFAESLGMPIFGELRLALTEKFLRWLERESGESFLLPQEREELSRLQSKLDSVQGERDRWTSDAIKQKLRAQRLALCENPSAAPLQDEIVLTADALARRHVLSVARSEIYASTNAVGARVADRIIPAARSVADKLLESERRAAEECGLVFAPSQRLLLCAYTGRGVWRTNYLTGMNPPSRLLCGILSWA